MNVKKRLTAALLGLSLVAGMGAIALQVSPASAATVPAGCSGFTLVGHQPFGNKQTPNAGRVDVYWKQSTSQNCVILTKIADKGTPSYTSLSIGASPTGLITDAKATYTSYAGPLIVKAPGCLYISAYMDVIATHATSDSGASYSNGSGPSYNTHNYGCSK